MAHSTPLTRPTPVMTPEPGASLSYMSSAASGDSSRNGEPGSSSARTRSRGRSLPRETWRLRASSPPPSRTFSVRCRRSSTRARMASALRLKVSERVSTVEERIVMSAANCPDRRRRARPLRQPRKGAPADVLADETSLVGQRGGKIGVVVGLFLDHDVGVAAEGGHDLGRPLLDRDARLLELL